MSFRTVTLPFRLVAPIVALTLSVACAPDTSTAPPSADASARPSAAMGAPAGHIRIGVVPEAEEVRIGGTAAYEVRDDVTGVLLLSGSASEATVTVRTDAVPVTFWRLQVECARPKPYVDDWVRRVTDAGYEPYTEFVTSANCWRLRVGRFPTEVAARTAQPELQRLGLSPASSGGGVSRVTILEGVTVYTAALAGAEVTSRNPLRVVPLDGRLTIAGLRYRGVGEVWINSHGTLAAINELPIEEYLLGVVPRELGPDVFPQLEALKAQAVAARTYAHVNLGKRSNDNYDLLGTPSDQVYGDITGERPLSTQAVEATAGVVAVHKGRLISALYSSTSGGFTANSEDVFSAVEPYLRGVPDHERGSSIDHVPSLEVFRSHANPTALRAAVEGDFESDWARLHRWYVEWSVAEMRQLLSDYFQTDVGEVSEVNVVERSNSGRALRLEVVAANGTFSETKDRIRSALKFINASGDPSALYSTLVFIAPVRDPRTKVITGFEAWGGGWGHGVGMSQTGAVGMAERGATYQEILSHYYREITLEKR
jgi:SpoIID/LytB domain protein